MDIIYGLVKEYKVKNTENKNCEFKSENKMKKIPSKILTCFFTGDIILSITRREQRRS